MTCKLLAFSGSTRASSHNQRLAALVCATAAQAGAATQLISLADYPLPLISDELLQAQLPEQARALYDLIAGHDAVFIASPEYNAGYTPLLKNMLDWVSRAGPKGEPAGTAFKKPVFALGAASPGGYGGVRAMMPIRQVLEMGLGALVIPEMVLVGGAGQAFDDEGALKDERPKTMLNGMVSALIAATSARG